jgi:hypothetical protein
MRALSFFGVLAAVVVAGCATRTQTFVVLDGDDVVRRDTRAIELEVRDDAGAVVREATLMPGAGDPPLPFSLALEPRGGDASRRFTVQVIARDEGGAEVARAEVRSGYVAGRALSLRVFLTTACNDVVCADPSTTCRNGRCEDLFVPPETLPDHPDDRFDAGPREDALPLLDAWMPLLDAGPVPDADHDAARVDTGPEPIDAGAMDAFSPDALAPDAFAPDAFTSPDAFAPDAFTIPDANAPDAGMDAGPPPLEPGVLLHVSGDPGTVADIVHVTGDDTQVCAAGRVRGAATVAGVRLDAPTSGIFGTWVACFDVIAGGTVRRYVRLLEPVGDTLVGAIALDASGRLYVGVNSNSAGRTFGTTTLTARAALVRLEHDGTISAAIPFSAPEIDEPTQAVTSGAQIFATGFASGGADTTVSLYETSAFARTSSLRTHTGLNVALDVGSAGVIVGGYFNPGSTDIATLRLVDRALGATLWSRDSVASGYVQAVAMNDAGHAFVGTRARFGDFQWAGTSAISRSADGTDPGDIVVTRFDATGTPVWITRPIVSTAGEDVVGAMDVADDGSVVAVGYAPDLVAPTGLTELAGRTSGREGWVMRMSADTGAPIAWDRVSATTDCVVQRMWRTGEWLYVTGLFRGTVTAAASTAFGAGLASTGMQDAFVVRMRVP